MSDIVIIGGGAFAREVHDVIEAMNEDGAGWRTLGVIDEGADRDVWREERDVEVLGGDDVIETLPAGTGFVIAMNSGSVRRRLDVRATAAGLRSATLIHPSAVLGRRRVEIAPGAIVTANVSITTNVRVGRHTHLNLNCTVGHDTVIGDYVSVNPGVNISGSVVIEDEVLIGTGAAVIQGITLGAGSTIGMGSAVIRDVAPGMTAIGVPAKPLWTRS